MVPKKVNKVTAAGIWKLSPAERRRLLLARKSKQTGRIQIRYGTYSLVYKVRDISSRTGWADKRKALAAETESDALIEASRFMVSINEQNQAGKHSVQCPTVEQFIKKHWDEYLTRNKRSISTINGYNSNLNRYVIPQIGKKPLKQVTPSDIDGILEGFSSQGKTEKSTLNLFAILRTLFDLAHQHEFLAGDSPVKPKLHRPKPKKKKKPTLTAEECYKVLTIVDPEYRLIFLFAAVTGYRAGELLALHWCNLDLINRVVQSTHKMYNGQRIEGLKTDDSENPIELAADLVMMLNEHRQQTDFSAEDDFVFCRSDGRAYDPQWLLEKIWYPALIVNEIEPGYRTHGFHLLRHSAATILAALTKDRQAVKDFLRHTQLATTDIYIHPGAAEGSEALVKEIFSKGQKVN
jgi:integrase